MDGDKFFGVACLDASADPLMRVKVFDFPVADGRSLDEAVEAAKVHYLHCHAGERNVEFNVYRDDAGESAIVEVVEPGRGQMVAFGLYKIVALAIDRSRPPGTAPTDPLPRPIAVPTPAG